MGVATDLRMLDYGDRALLLECESTAEVLAWTDTLRQADLLGVTDIVPASRTVLVKVDGARYLPLTRQRIEKLRPVPDDGIAAPGVPDMVIDVVYDGADLDEGGGIAGLGAAGVVAAHTGTPWRVAFGGFVPGFAYLVGGHPPLHLARRGETAGPRPRRSAAAGGA